MRFPSTAFAICLWKFSRNTLMCLKPGRICQRDALSCHHLPLSSFCWHVLSIWQPRLVINFNQIEKHFKMQKIATWWSPSSVVQILVTFPLSYNHCTTSNHILLHTYINKSGNMKRINTLPTVNFLGMSTKLFISVSNHSSREKCEDRKFQFLSTRPTNLGNDRSPPKKEKVKEKR